MGYFDLQVNGYFGIDYNRRGLTLEQLRLSCDKQRAVGVDQFLATVITEDVDIMASYLARLVELRQQDVEVAAMLCGFHIEGPFINPTDGYRGAHPVDAVRPADLDAMKKLLDAAAGLTRLVTLAPEYDDGLQVTRYLVEAGITVSAGHCNPTMQQLEAAADAGLSLFTHLGNGCPMQMHRHENIIQRVLSLSERIMPCFIADGAHVAFSALGNYIRAAGVDRCCVVTDAIPAAGLGPGEYTLGRWKIKIGDDMVARAPDGSHLIGAAIDMQTTFDNLVKHVGLRPSQAAQLMCDNPRMAVGLI